MAGIRKTIISNCEKAFLVKNLKQWNRLDGRAFDEFRGVELQFGKDWGCCLVSLGKTKVVAQVSCEVQQPKASRPSEGVVNINVELNPMADSSFEAGRLSEQSAQLNRLLEKCLKDSKAVDLESLCIQMNEKVWALRVDVNVLNHEGNILDCASIAALAALAHFRRPDVTCDGEEFIVHSYKQRDPIPTVIHHYPVCITYAIFADPNQGEGNNTAEDQVAPPNDYVLADPNFLEENAAHAFLSIGLNSYKELCGLHLGGSASVTQQLILTTTRKASTRAIKVVEQIKYALAQDEMKRRNIARDYGFHISLISDEHEETMKELSECLDQWVIGKKKNKKKKYKKDVDTTKTKKTKKNTEHTDDSINEDVDNIQEKVVTNNKSISKKSHDVTSTEVWTINESDDEVVCIENSRPVVELMDSESSEEEAVTVLNADVKTNKKKKKLKT